MRFYNAALAGKASKLASRAAWWPMMTKAPMMHPAECSLRLTLAATQLRLASPRKAMVLTQKGTYDRVVAC